LEGRPVFVTVVECPYDVLHFARQLASVLAHVLRPRSGGARGLPSNELAVERDLRESAADLIVQVRRDSVAECLALTPQLVVAICEPDLRQQDDACKGDRTHARRP